MVDVELAYAIKTHEAHKWHGRKSSDSTQM